MNKAKFLLGFHRLIMLTCLVSFAAKASASIEDMFFMFNGSDGFYMYHDHKYICVKDGESNVSLTKWSTCSSESYSIKSCNFAQFINDHKDDISSSIRLIVCYDGSAKQYLEAVQELKTFTFINTNRIRIIEDLQVASYKNLETDHVWKISYKNRMLSVDYGDMVYECDYSSAHDADKQLKIKTETQLLQLLLHGGSAYLNMLSNASGELLLTCLPFKISSAVFDGSTYNMYSQTEYGRTQPLIERHNLSDFPVRTNDCRNVLILTDKNGKKEQINHNVRPIIIPGNPFQQVKIDVNADGIIRFYQGNEEYTIFELL